MQFGRFINGGFYLHKITGNFKGRVSAWFDRDGKPLDAEQIPVPFGSSRPVKKGGPIWRKIEQLGQRYRHIPAE
jgi:hypothetical protein